MTVDRGQPALLGAGQVRLDGQHGPDLLPAPDPSTIDDVAVA